MSVLRLSDVRRLAAQALQNGGLRKSMSTVEWDISSNCEKPVCVEVNGQKGHAMTSEGTKVRRNGFTRVIMETRCRQCGPCLRYRSQQWAARAEREVRAATRTWFCTFTLSPHEHHMSWVRICQHLRQTGVSPDALSATEGFKLRADAAQRLFQLAMKRVRKAGKSQIKYLLVVESHKSGLPHLHALVHEYGAPLSKRQLQGEWPHGHSLVKLIDENQASSIRYVCKYLAKQAVSRVRASMHYGETISTR